MATTPAVDSPKQHVNSFVIPFVLISVIMLTSQIISLILTMNTSLSQIHNQTAQLQALNLESAARQPIVEGHWDQLQAVVDKAKANSSDVTYVTVEAPDGRVLASTNPAARNTVQAGPGYDSAVLKVTENCLLTGPEGGLESIGLIKKDSTTIGIVRVGVGIDQLMDAIHLTMFTTIFGGMGTLLIGALVFRLFVERILVSIWPSDN